MGGCVDYVCMCISMSVCMESDAKQDLKLIEIRHNKLSNSVFFLFCFRFPAQLVFCDLQTYLQALFWKNVVDKPILWQYKFQSTCLGMNISSHTVFICFDVFDSFLKKNFLCYFLLPDQRSITKHRDLYLSVQKIQGYKV